MNASNPMSADLVIIRTSSCEVKTEALGAFRKLDMVFVPDAFADLIAEVEDLASFLDEMESDPSQFQDRLQLEPDEIRIGVLGFREMIELD